MSGAPRPWHSLSRGERFYTLACPCVGAARTGAELDRLSGDGWLRGLCLVGVRHCPGADGRSVRAEPARGAAAGGRSWRELRLQVRPQRARDGRGRCGRGARPSRPRPASATAADPADGGPSMRLRKQQRLALVILAVLLVGGAAGLVLAALQDKVAFFVTPTAGRRAAAGAGQAVPPRRAGRRRQHPARGRRDRAVRGHRQGAARCR